MASNPISSKNQIARRPNWPNFQHQHPSTSQNRQNLPKFSNEVYEMLKCPVCYEVMQLPIYMCTTGHNICNTCKCTRTNINCPLCNAPFSSQRNFALEKISATTVVPCLNKSYGCELVTSREKISKHVGYCQYQQYICPMQKYSMGCSWKGNISVLLDHFERNHPSNIVLTPGSQVTFKNLNLNLNDRNMQLFIYSNLYFLYHIKIDVVSKIVGWAIQYVGSEEKAEDWNYEIVIYNSSNLRRKITFLNSCLPYRASADEAIGSGQCAVIPLQVMRSYLNANGDFTFKFYMRERIERTTVAY
ncbi:E3 ubiquitin-protein ligase SIAH1B-like [Arctopsyche grandis]|uniref:E3 ubiquitin-protein ligase SIAH1B-like n=1 Tax=Arctopsyche grandis TaxID=121162 RepID=UPI00406D7FB5